MAAATAFGVQSIADLSDGASACRISCALDVDAEGKLPEWIQLAPVGDVEARDGRRFAFEHLSAIARNTELPLLIDRDHVSEHRVSDRGTTIAAGWVEELRVQEGDEGDFPRAGIWGRAKWSESASREVSGDEWRFLSPVLVGTRTEIGGTAALRVDRLASVALTNCPALSMAALNSFRERLSIQLGLATPTGGQRDMDPETQKALCAALGLPDGADAGAIVEAASASKAGKEVAQYREACARLTTDLGKAQAEVSELRAEKAAHDKELLSRDVKAVIDGAAREGRITPAQVENWTEFCSRSRADLDMFSKTVLPALPKQGEPAPESAPHTNPGPEGSIKFDREALRETGLTDEEIDAAAADVEDQNAAIAAAMED